MAALAQIPVLKPDVVTLDIEMPQMDGLETLRQIRKHHPQLRTIMFSTLTTRGASATFEALALGADDYVAKASNAGSLDKSLASLRTELVPKIKQFFAPTGKPLDHSRRARRAPARLRRRIEAAGAGDRCLYRRPASLGRADSQAPGQDFPLPVLIVQHMPPMFTRLLAETSAGLSPLRSRGGGRGEPIVPGRVYSSRPATTHLRVRRAGPSFFTRSRPGSARELLPAGGGRTVPFACRELSAATSCRWC